MQANSSDMWKYKLTFKAISNTLSFFVESENKKLIEEFVYGFFELFGNAKLKKIEVHQINDDATRTKVIKFIEKFKDRFPPSLNQVVAFFNRLENDESFLFLPEINLTIDVSARLHNYLVSLKSGESLESLNLNFEKVFGNVLINYDIFPNGTV